MPGCRSLEAAVTPSPAVGPRGIDTVEKAIRQFRRDAWHLVATRLGLDSHRAPLLLAKSRKIDPDVRSRCRFAWIEVSLGQPSDVARSRRRRVRHLRSAGMRCPVSARQRRDGLALAYCAGAPDIW